MRYQIIKMSACKEHTKANRSVYKKGQPEYLSDDINLILKEFVYMVEHVYNACDCKIEVVEIVNNQIPFLGSDQ